MNSDQSKADEKKKESASKEFSSVVDATSEFMKKIFPHTYSLIAKLRGEGKKVDEKKASEYNC